VHSRDASVVYHVQEQRYSFVVEAGEENPGRVYIPVEAEVEDLVERPADPAASWR
jgi:hypothetical protein